jgi:hypothetical protein
LEDDGVMEVFSELDESKGPICERLAAVLVQHIFHNYGLFIRTIELTAPRRFRWRGFTPETEASRASMASFPPPIEAL